MQEAFGYLGHGRFDCSVGGRVGEDGRCIFDHDALGCLHSSDSNRSGNEPDVSEGNGAGDVLAGVGLPGLDGGSERGAPNARGFETVWRPAAVGKIRLELLDVGPGGGGVEGAPRSHVSKDRKDRGGVGLVEHVTGVDDGPWCWQAGDCSLARCLDGGGHGLGLAAVACSSGDEGDDGVDSVDEVDGVLVSEFAAEFCLVGNVGSLDDGGIEHLGQIGRDLRGSFGFGEVGPPLGVSNEEPATCEHDDQNEDACACEERGLAHVDRNASVGARRAARTAG